MRLSLRLPMVVVWLVLGPIGCRASSKSATLGERPLRVSAADAEAPDISKVGVPAVVRWSEARLREAEQSFKLRGLSRYPSPDFWGGEAVYSIMVDRFNDGDPSNNSALLSAAQRGAEQSHYAGINEYRHGGDLKGIRDRLDYLADLGVTALWLTPVFLNSGGDYHGYCVSDPTKLDPSFGSPEELVQLVAAAHKRGIRIILDIVVNHICDGGTHYAQALRQDEHSQCAADLDAANIRGGSNESRFQRELVFGPEFFPPFKLGRFFNRCGANSLEEMRGEGPATRFGDFTAKMLDFNTRDPDFQKIFKNLMAYWIAYADVDGFRLDAVKHVTSDFTAYFSTQIRDYGNRLGKTHIYTVGEIAGASQTITLHLGRMNPSKNTQAWHNLVEAVDQTGDSLLKTAAGLPAFPYPGLTGVYDFGHSGTVRDVLNHQRTSQVLEQYFRTDSYYRDLIDQGDPRLNLTLLEIHDWPRFAGDSLKQASLGLAYLAAAPGIPVIYYGMEQGFNGRCVRGSIEAAVEGKDIESFCFTPEGGGDDAHYRQDMFQSGMFRLGSAQPEINALAHIGNSAPVAKGDGRRDPYLNQDHELYRTARRFLKIRKSCLPLRVGEMTWRWSLGVPGGFMAFSRVDPVRRSAEALVLVNLSDQDLAIPDLGVENRGVVFANLERPGELARPKGDDGGTVEFGSRRIPRQSVQVYVPTAMVGEAVEVDATHLCKP